jgi:hypothetical protein
LDLLEAFSYSQTGHPKNVRALLKRIQDPLFSAQDVDEV